MAAKSKAQQRLFGLAYAYKKGELKSSEVSQEVIDMAESMPLKKLKDYASTKHDDLPDKVKDENIDEVSAIYQGPIKKYRNKMATDFEKEYNGNYTLHFGNKKVLEVPPSDIRLVESKNQKFSIKYKKRKSVGSHDREILVTKDNLNLKKLHQHIYKIEFEDNGWYIKGHISVKDENNDSFSINPDDFEPDFKKFANNLKFNESKSGVFALTTTLFPYQIDIVAHNWQKEDRKNKITVEKDSEGDYIVYGYKKGNKEAEWKWYGYDFEFFHDYHNGELSKLLKKPAGKVKSVREAAEATLANTLGMGPITFPGDPGDQAEFADQEEGSGDIPADSKKKKKKLPELGIELQEPSQTIYKTFESFLNSIEK